MIHAIAGLPDLFTGFSPITPRLERSTNPAAGPDWNTEDIPMLRGEPVRFRQPTRAHP